MASGHWARRGPGFVILVLLLAAASPLTVPGSTAAQVTTPSGGKTFEWPAGYSLVQHPIPEPTAEPWSIAVDPRGMVWFVEQGTNQLGEYDPGTSSFTQYPIPTPHSTPDAVTTDARGDVWFTELTSNKLGELPSGSSAISEFQIPGVAVSLGGSEQTLSCGPGAVLADPAGGVWVACLFSNQLDEFFPSGGTFSSYDLPVFQSGPAGMALDGKGDIWFTAADANMLGMAVVSQLRNGTDQGISEFAPADQAYSYSFEHPTSFLGATEVLTSSIATPSGIAIGQSGKVWVTEHVDSSFDSYDPANQSLAKYWTTQTFGAYGYPVTFPNGIAVGSDGTVWVGEHYGNRIAEFDPTAGAMTEYPVPCCGSSIAGVYSVALAPDGRLWFVEIGGDAIGEVAPLQGRPALSLSLPGSSFVLGPQGAATFPLTYSSSSRSATNLSLSVSGVTATGAVQNMTASFSSGELALPGGGQARSNLTFALAGLKPGVYYLSLGATANGGATYTAVIRLTVAPGTPLQLSFALPVAAGAILVTGAGGWLLARRSRGGRGRRRRRSLLISLTRKTASTATPTPTARYTE